MSTETTRQFFNRYMEAMMTGEKTPEKVAHYPQAYPPRRGLGGIGTVKSGAR